MPSVIFDIDGTLADCSHRLHLIKGAKKDWESFHNSMVGDTPITSTIDILHGLNFMFYEFAFCTGRPVTHMDQTRSWLSTHVGEWTVNHPLYMRPKGDFRPDYVVKEEMLVFMRSQGFYPIAAFEDREQVVKMWRKNGLICYQVAEGAY